MDKFLDRSSNLSIRREETKLKNQVDRLNQHRLVNLSIAFIRVGRRRQYEPKIGVGWLMITPTFHIFVEQSSLSSN